jgi:hypothetical protein
VTPARRWHNHTPLEAGMVVSNEPGYYEDGAFGIRIENLLIIREEPTPHRFGGAAFLGFERLTLCPLQRKMIALEARRPPARPGSSLLRLWLRSPACPVACSLH